jgi:hypothetical protein
MKILDKLFKKYEDEIHDKYKTIFKLIRHLKTVEHTYPDINIVFNTVLDHSVWHYRNRYLFYCKNDKEIKKYIKIVQDVLTIFGYQAGIEEYDVLYVKLYGKRHHDIHVGIHYPIPYVKEKDFIDEVVDINVSTLEKDINDVLTRIDEIKESIKNASKAGYTNFDVKFINLVPNTTYGTTSPTNKFYYYLTLTDTSSLVSVKKKVIEYFINNEFNVKDNGDEINISWREKVTDKLKNKGLLKEEEEIEF